MELTHRLELWSAVYETAALPVELCQREMLATGESTDELRCKRSTFKRPELER